MKISPKYAVIICNQNYSIAQFLKICTIPQNREKEDISIDHHDFYTLLGEVLENLRFKTFEKLHKALCWPGY